MYVISNFVGLHSLFLPTYELNSLQISRSVELIWRIRDKTEYTNSLGYRELAVTTSYHNLVQSVLYSFHISFKATKMKHDVLDFCR